MVARDDEELPADLLALASAGAPLNLIRARLGQPAGARWSYDSHGTRWPAIPDPIRDALARNSRLPSMNQLAGVNA